jgi:hypothetical protein
LQHAKQVQCEIDWWIFWGRIAGGLNRNQQVDLYQRIAPFLLPRGSKKQPRLNSSLLREMWRTAASLELLPIQTKTELGDALVKMIKAGAAGESELWCISRLGARELFYGPVNLVLPPAAVSRWIEALMPLATAVEALASLARRTDDSTRDLPPATREAVRQKLTALARPQPLLAIFEGEEGRDERALGRIFGEELPSGLVLVEI